MISEFSLSILNIWIVFSSYKSCWIHNRAKKTTNIRGWQVQLIEYLFTLSLVFSLNSVYWTNSNKHFQYFIISLIYSCLLLLFVFSLWKLVKKHQMTISFIRLVYFYSTFLFIFVIINFNREMIGKIEIIKFLVFFYYYYLYYLIE